MPKKEAGILYMKGIAMGMADAVPGVSGGTIAFISGIYEELIDSIRSFNPDAVRLLMRRRFGDFWRHVNGTFLVVLLSGIGSAILLFSRLILYGLANHPEKIWSFFFGLIVASAIVIARKIDRWGAVVVVSGLAGAAVGYAITLAVPAETPETLGFVFLSGMIAICAMILPGISGSFILVLLSKYEYVFTAVKDLNLGILMVFGFGCAAGILSFSHLLNWTLKRCYTPTIAFLTGLMLGALNKVWPWKQVVASFVTPSGKVKPLVEKNLLPGTFETLTGRDAHLTAAVACAVAGFCLVYFLDRLAAGRTAAPAGRTSDSVL